MSNANRTVRLIMLSIFIMGVISFTQSGYAYYNNYGLGGYYGGLYGLSSGGLSSGGLSSGGLSSGYYGLGSLYGGLGLYGLGGIYGAGLYGGLGLYGLGGLYGASLYGAGLYGLGRLYGAGLYGLGGIYGLYTMGALNNLYSTIALQSQSDLLGWNSFWKQQLSSPSTTIAQ